MLHYSVHVQPADKRPEDSARRAHKSDGTAEPVQKQPVAHRVPEQKPADAAEPEQHSVRTRIEAIGHQGAFVAGQSQPTQTLPLITGLWKFLTSLDSPFKKSTCGGVETTETEKRMYAQV